MKARSVVTNPMPGDVVSYNGWNIVVTDRQNDVVMCVGDKGTSTRRSSYSLAEWGEWAKDAKVRSRPLEAHECQTSTRVSAPCSVDGVYPKVVHVWGNEFFCEEHCGATKHWPGRA